MSGIVYLKLKAHIWVPSVGRWILFFAFFIWFYFCFPNTQLWISAWGLSSKNSVKPQQSIVTVSKPNVLLLCPPSPCFCMFPSCPQSPRATAFSKLYPDCKVTLRSAQSFIQSARPEGNQGSWLAINNSYDERTPSYNLHNRGGPCRQTILETLWGRLLKGAALLGKPAEPRDVANFQEPEETSGSHSSLGQASSWKGEL